MPALVRAGVLGGARPLLVPLRVGMEKRSYGVAFCVVKGEGRGHGRLLALVLGLGLHGLDGPWLLGLYLLGHRGPPERLTNRCLEIPGVL